MVNQGHPSQHSDFTTLGFIQQHGAFLVRFGRVVDAAMILLALFAVVYLEGLTWTKDHLVLGLLNVLTFQVVSSLFELYRSWRMVRLRRELANLFAFWSVACLIVSFAMTLVEGQQSGATLVLKWYALGFVAMGSSRIVLRLMLRHYRALGFDRRRVAFAGVNGTSLNLERTFRTHPWMGFELIGFFDDRMIFRGNPEAVKSEAFLAGDYGDLVTLARSGKIDAIYICLPMAAEKRIKKLIDDCAGTTASIYYCPSFFEFGLLNARWDDVFGQPVVSIVDSPYTGHDRLIKRAEDLVLAVLLLIALALPMALIALGIRLTSPGPILFKQNRLGLDGRPFKIWKFRTMTVAESDGEFRQATKNDSRVTPFGAFLRKTSLDELPQLINVVRGDMSIVGPRPHPVKLNEDHRDVIYRYMFRHKVKPGITGLAQVNGYRGETDTEEKMQKRIEYDLVYIRGWSLWMDVKILLKTVSAVFSAENAY